MCMDIKNYKTVIVTGTIGNNASAFNATIDLSFQPHEVILKNVTIADNDADNADDIILFNTDMFYPNAFYHFGGALMDDGTNTQYGFRYNAEPHLKYKISKQIRGISRFWVTQINNTAPSNIAGFDMLVAFTFEFVEYHNK